MHAEYQDRHARQRFAHFRHQRQAATGQRQVQYQHIRMLHLHRDAGLCNAATLGHDLEIGFLLDEGAEAGADDGMVVGHDDSNHGVRVTSRARMPTGIFPGEPGHATPVTIGI